MHTCKQRRWRGVGCPIVCAAILLSSGACASQRSWDDSSPGNSGPDLADVGGAILGVGYFALYFFAQCASGGSSGTGLDEYSYAHQYRR